MLGAPTCRGGQRCPSLLFSRPCSLLAGGGGWEPQQWRWRVALRPHPLSRFTRLFSGPCRERHAGTWCLECDQMVYVMSFLITCMFRGAVKERGSALFLMAHNDCSCSPPTRYSLLSCRPPLPHPYIARTEVRRLHHFATSPPTHTAVSLVCPQRGRATRPRSTLFYFFAHASRKTLSPTLTSHSSCQRRS